MESKESVFRKAFLPFAACDTGEAELAEIADTLRTGWLTTGPKTRMFEAEFASWVGAKYAVAVNSCTAALHLALTAIHLQQDDEVITTPYTFAATAEVVRYFGARPVFVDVDPRTFNIRPDLVREAITGRTKAIIPVHMAGLPAEMDTILKIAQSRNLAVIEDAAHAFTATYNGRNIGSLSDFTCFSFYATKTMTTGEGGMICTDNGKWADECRSMALHGISRDAWNRYTREGSWYYEITAPGYKYNLTDLASSLGLVQLQKAGRMRARRQMIAEQYDSVFKTLRELQTPFDDSRCTHAWHLYMLRLNLDQLQIDRSQFIAELGRRNIGTSVHFIPLHIHPYYRQTYGFEPEDFPVAYSEYMREISLPIYSKMTDEDVMAVIEAVRDVVRCYRIRKVFPMPRVAPESFPMSERT